MQPHELEVVKWLASDEKYKNIKTILNIGVNVDPRRNDIDLVHRLFQNREVEISHLEIYEPYVKNGPSKYPKAKFYLGDVREVDKISEKFDLIFCLI